MILQHKWSRASPGSCLIFFTLHPTLSMDVWLVLKAGISWDVILQDTSKEALKSTAKKAQPHSREGRITKDVPLWLGFRMKNPNDTAYWGHERLKQVPRHLLSPQTSSKMTQSNDAERQTKEQGATAVSAPEQENGGADLLVIAHLRSNNTWEITHCRQMHSSEAGCAKALTETLVLEAGRECECCRTSSSPSQAGGACNELSAWDLQVTPGESGRTGPKHIVERSELCRMFH